MKNRYLGITILICSIIALVGLGLPWGTMVVSFGSTNYISTYNILNITFGPSTYTWVEIANLTSIPILNTFTSVIGMGIILVAIMIVIIGILQIVKSDIRIMQKINPNIRILPIFVSILGITLLILSIVGAISPGIIFTNETSYTLISIMPNIGGVIMLIPAIGILVLAMISILNVDFNKILAKLHKKKLVRDDQSSESGKMIEVKSEKQVKGLKNLNQEEKESEDYKLPLKSQFVKKKGSWRLWVRNGYSNKSVKWFIRNTTPFEARGSIDFPFTLWLAMGVVMLIAGLFFGIGLPEVLSGNYDALYGSLFITNGQNYNIQVFLGSFIVVLVLILLIITYIIIRFTLLFFRFRKNNEIYREEGVRVDKLTSKFSQYREIVKNYIPEAAKSESLHEIKSIYQEVKRVIETDLSEFLEKEQSLQIKSFKELQNYYRMHNWLFIDELKPKVKEMEKIFNDVDQLIKSIKVFREEILERIADLIRDNIVPGSSISIDHISELIRLNRDATVEIMESLQEENILPGKYINEEERFIGNYSPPVDYSKLSPISDINESIEIMKAKIDYVPISDVLFFLQMKDRIELEKLVSSKKNSGIRLTSEYVVFLQNQAIEVNK